MNIYEAIVVAGIENCWIRRKGWCEGHARSAAICCRKSPIWSDVRRRTKHGSKNRRKSNGKINTERE